MRKILKNLVYDTETANLVGCSTNAPKSEKLYRKKTGEYFLYVKSGAIEKYNAPLRHTDPKTREAILPLEDKDAQAWAKENLTDENYRAEFVEIVKDPEPTVIHATIRTDTKQFIDDYKFKRDLTSGQVIDIAISRLKEF